MTASSEFLTHDRSGPGIKVSSLAIPNISRKSCTIMSMLIFAILALFLVPRLRSTGTLVVVVSAPLRRPSLRGLPRPLFSSIGAVNSCSDSLLIVLLYSFTILRSSK